MTSTYESWEIGSIRDALLVAARDAEDGSAGKAALHLVERLYSDGMPRTWPKAGEDTAHWRRTTEGWQPTDELRRFVHVLWSAVSDHAMRSSPGYDRGFAEEEGWWAQRKVCLRQLADKLYRDIGA